MPGKDRGKANGVIRTLDLKNIDPSPYQRRRVFHVDRLKELASSIQREGLISPILVRPTGKRHELIAGERRLRAIRDHTDIKTIQARIVAVDDIGARRMSAAENLQREDLAIIETIEAIVAIIDAELIGDAEYNSMGKHPVERVEALLGKLHSIANSKDRGSQVSQEGELLLDKFVQQVEKVFKKLPKPLEWRSFYRHDLNLLVDICMEVQDAAVQHDLNKSQTRALAKLNAASESGFQGLVGPQPSGNRALSDFSATEIEAIANKEIQKRALAEQAESRSMSSLSAEAKVLLQARLGIPDERIAERLKINRKTVAKHCERLKLFRSIRDSLGKGLSASETAKKWRCPEPLVWSIELEGKSDPSRFKALNWGLRTWDLWNWNDCDKRFGDDWPARHCTRLSEKRRDKRKTCSGEAGGGVVADTCLAFNRKCWSFDMADRPDTRPEIERFPLPAGFDFLLFSSTFDVGRSMFDVHLFNRSSL